MLKGFVLTTLNKLPQIKPDLVRSAENWEDWGMEDLLKALQKWLKINKAEDPPRKHDEKRGRNWYTGKREQKVHAKPHCLFCEKDHWGEACEVVNTIAKRREFFMTKRLCFNCGRPGHREKNVVVVVVLSVKPDTTLVSAIGKKQSSLVTSRQLKRNLCLPSYHWKYKALSFGRTWTVAQVETLYQEMQ